ncbi:MULTISPECIES: DNA/RNA non-specific endonuclease [unclassified Mesorhizobium]|uniref:DNA/RNA non-specific endonuclease n=1 Tax=unclassified Mesorhizobium TaxID=325217 RepID=UPI0003D026B0|nr:MULTISPECIES: DNA/RNA non-specific endonuclease [unclassified Mesorhizobium]ESZ04411.1 hypothetical protein X736_22060 [Mesorhizobium sp. L2C089B000]WJI52353.1 DNA/RNA non-specific endonuclease [Mesorhizobium sp. C089B]
MTPIEAERLLAAFKRKHHPGLLGLASHAALPVVLNPEVVHLLRINYFLDPPYTLPYKAEASLLLSSVCTEIDDGLYIIDPAIRDLLLARLVADFTLLRVRDAARLLWEYSGRATPWGERLGLAEAQQLTALNFIDPARALGWLSRARRGEGALSINDDRWFVALESDLRERASAVGGAEDKAVRAKFSQLEESVSRLTLAKIARFSRQHETFVADQLPSDVWAALAASGVTSVDEGGNTRLLPIVRSLLFERLRAEPLLGVTILWVDDRPINNDDVVDESRTQGATVIQVLSTEDALKHPNLHGIDLVISDMVRPPDGDAGFQLLDQLRAIRFAAPVIIYSAEFASDGAKRQSVLDRGGFGCTNDPDELMALVEEAATRSVFLQTPTPMGDLRNAAEQAIQEAFPSFGLIIDAPALSVIVEASKFSPGSTTVRINISLSRLFCAAIIIGKSLPDDAEDADMLRAFSRVIAEPRWTRLRERILRIFKYDSTEQALHRLRVGFSENAEAALNTAIFNAEGGARISGNSLMSALLDPKVARDSLLSRWVPEREMLQLSAALARAGDRGELTSSDGAGRLKTPIHDPDYSTRKGYDPGFLGVSVPAPSPAPETVVAVDGKMMIAYHHFSLALHMKRRLALFTASNVDASPAARKPEPSYSYDRKSLTGLDKNETERWLVDPRIAPAFQLPGRFFSNEKGAFDKGHAVRRHDVAWGSSFREVQFANGDTYHFTNCLPLAAGFNQSAQVIDNWGDVENFVMEQARSSRISIFTGPSLADDDPIFVGVGDIEPIRVQISREYWRVIVAFDGSQLLSFGFVLRQQLSEEDLEFVVDTVWRPSMVPIADIEARNPSVRFDRATLEADQFSTAAGAQVARSAGIEILGDQSRRNPSSFDPLVATIPTGKRWSRFISRQIAEDLGGSTMPSRFSDPSAASRWRVLYLADSFGAALQQAIVSFVSSTELQARSINEAALGALDWIEVETSRQLKLVDLRRSPLVEPDLPDSLVARPATETSRELAEACFSHPQNFDGIMWSVSDGSADQIALFADRTRDALTVLGRRSVQDSRIELNAALADLGLQLVSSAPPPPEHSEAPGRLVALVVGNDGPPGHALHFKSDLDIVSTLFQDLGFETTVVYNQSVAAVREVLSSVERLRAEAAVLYWSGHFLGKGSERLFLASDSGIGQPGLGVAIGEIAEATRRSSVRRTLILFDGAVEPGPLDTAVTTSNEVLWRRDWAEGGKVTVLAVGTTGVELDNPLAETFARVIDEKLRRTVLSGGIAVSARELYDELSMRFRKQSTRRQSVHPELFVQDTKNEFVFYPPTRPSYS